MTESPDDVPRFLDLPAEVRLQRVALWGGVVLALSSALPHHIVDGQLVFSWQLLPELGSAGILAALAGTIVGAFVLLLRAWARSARVLAHGVLVALCVLVLWTRLGSDAEAWGMLAVPDGIGHRSPLLLFALSTAGAGYGLLREASLRRHGRALMALSVVLMVAFFLAPFRGEAPLFSLLHLVGSMFGLGDARLILGHALFGLLLLFPLAMSVLCVVYAVRPAMSVPRALPALPTAGLPLLLVLLVFRGLLLTFGDSSVVTLLSVAVLLAAVMELLRNAIEVVVRDAVKAGPRALRSAGMSVACLIACVAPQAWLSRPPAKGIEWALSATSAQGDRLFGELLSKWNLTRAVWQAALESGEAARPMVAMQAAARDLQDEAEALDPTVADAVRALVVQSRDLDLAGRRWSRLVSDLNQAAQRKGLPYYVDADVLLSPSADGLERRFSAVGYRIDAVSPVSVSGRPFATLRVRQLGEARPAHGLLGFSRDWQPFALVVADEIDAEVTALEARGEGEVAYCDELPLNDAAASACQRILDLETARGNEALRATVTAMTERHELQHQIDGPQLVMAGAVERKLAGVRVSDKDRTNRELSAYLAEMTPKDVQPKLTLLWLLKFGAHDGIGINHQIAALLLGALASDAKLQTGIRVNGSDVQHAVVALSTLDDDELRSRAHAAWTTLFGSELPTVRAH